MIYHIHFHIIVENNQSQIECNGWCGIGVGNAPAGGAKTWGRAAADQREPARYIADYVMAIACEVHNCIHASLLDISD